ncbi:hypothetical protein F4861DRAFT_538647 [Xylaria intraflava]|nr:hypothetical protein F4861DRAFT_538647 [Xylaria intraflava]
MTGPTSFDALQARLGVESPSFYSPQVLGDNGDNSNVNGANQLSHQLNSEQDRHEMPPRTSNVTAQSSFSHFTLRPDPTRSPPIPQASPPSSYLDPLILADDGYRNHQPPNQLTGMVQSQPAGKAIASRNNLASILPKPPFTGGSQGVLPTAAWSNETHAAPGGTTEDNFIDFRLPKTPSRDSGRLPRIGANLGQPASQETTTGFTGNLESTPYPPNYTYPVPSRASVLAQGLYAGEFANTPTPGPPDSAGTTDALLERQLGLQDESDDESESENRQYHSRYNDEDYNESRHGSRGRGRGRGGRGRGTRRGPRKAAEPTGDVKYRINMAWNAYVDGRLDEAIEWVEDAIRINAETYRAWALLTTFLEEKGDLKGSFTARVFSCHLQPRHVDGWLYCAEIGIALRDEIPEDAVELLEQVSVCYSAALRADINNQQARHGRAAISFERGQIRTAAKDYLYLLEHGEYDIHALRSYAEITIILANTGKRDSYKPDTAIDWYYRAIAHFEANNDDSSPLEWQDVNIFASLLAYIEHTKDALYELKSLARRLLGRADEHFWDDWQDDDREWDVDNIRRLGFGDYQEGKYPEASYGGGLPLNLRTKLAVYRLRLGDIDEAQRHISHLDPNGPNWANLLSNEPDLLAEVASALYESDQQAMALRFFEPLLSIPDVLDAGALLAAGRCYLDTGDKRQAEECFSAAIDADEVEDEASIDARYELAKMYEAAREEQEAYILVNEAIRLQRVHDEAEREVDEEDDMGEFEGSDYDTRKRHGASAGITRRERLRNWRAPRPPRPRAPRSLASRPRRKVFAPSEEATLEEKRKIEGLNTAWRIVHNTWAAADGDGIEVGPSDAFMRSAKELVDDFRSYKGFYSWEKYLNHLGIDEDKQVYVPRNRNLIELKERLSHSMSPYGPSSGRQLGERTAVSYRNVSFSEWLNLFLEYAIGLAHCEKFQESYQVCESARDAEVFAKNKEDMFLIHVTLAACALRARDEETCVAAARFLMRDRQFDTDPFRMFAALCRLCPSPASWYASGPVQKYMLRQIKLMDRALVSGDGEDSEEEETKANGGRVYSSKDLDVTLLVLYGHILFVSNSFTYALNYFLRAYSIDPTNQMILLSVGQCYIHYALKRQSENRQYLLVQGFVFLHRYYDLKVASADAAERQEAHYNMARSYHAIGVPHLAAEFYQRVLRDIPDDAEPDVFGKTDLSQEAAYNLQQICWAGGDLDAARGLGERYLTL